MLGATTGSGGGGQSAGFVLPSQPMAPGSGSTRQSYHHGNLRRALIEAAAARIEEAGPAGLTLRVLAGRLGVSHAAPYRHFRGKGDLLGAVAEEGYCRLARALQEADATGPDEVRLRRLAKAYLDFARQRPALYRLMQGLSAVNESVGADAGRDGRGEVVGAIEEAVHAATASCGPAVDRRTLVLVTWATLDGLCRLALDARPSAPAVDELIDTAVRGILAGAHRAGRWRSANQDR